MNQALDLIRRYWLWILITYMTLNPSGASELTYAIGSRLHMILESVLGSF